MKVLEMVEISAVSGGNDFSPQETGWVPDWLLNQLFDSPTPWYGVPDWVLNQIAVMPPVIEVNVNVSW